MTVTGVPRVFTSKYGKTGLANVKKTGDGWQVTFADDNSNFNIMAADAVQGTREAKCYVTLDEHNTAIKFIKPPEGAYYAKFYGFYAEDGQPPMYRDKEYQPATKNRNWDIPAHLEMTAQFYILEHEVWKDFIVSKPIVYAFTEYMDTGIAAITGYGSKKLASFLEELGIDMMKDTIPYSDNILPALQDMLLEKGVKLVLTVGKGGWINSIITAP